jgi:uncharacterized membrane protein YvlD (DUF360 family)
MKNFKLSVLLFCFTQVHTSAVYYQNQPKVKRIRKVVYYEEVPNGVEDQAMTSGIADKEIIFIFTKYNYEPPLSAQDIKKKQHQMKLLGEKIPKNIAMLSLLLIIGSLLFPLIPVVNYTEKSQFKKDGKLTDPVITFIIVMAILSTALFILDFFDLAKMFIRTNHLVSIIINSLRLLLTYIFYGSIIKCLLVYFEVKLLDAIQLNFFWAPLITMAIILLLSTQLKWIMTWWGMPISYLFLGLFNRFLLKDLFTLNKFFSTELYYWMLTFTLAWIGLMQKGAFDQLKSSYLKSHIFFRDSHLNLIAWDMTMNFMLKVTSALLHFVLKVVVNHIKNTHRKNEEEEPTDLRESIRNKFSDDQNIINSL